MAALTDPSPASAPVERRPCVDAYGHPRHLWDEGEGLFVCVGRDGPPPVDAAEQARLAEAEAPTPKHPRGHRCQECDYRRWVAAGRGNVGG